MLPKPHATITNRSSAQGRIRPSAQTWLRNNLHRFRLPGRIIQPLVFLCILPGLSGSLALAEDWPTYRRDFHRSGVTSEQPDFPLHLRWIHQPALAPQPSWPGPAEQDYWHNLHGLSPTMIYDRAFHPVIASGRLYFGSSADDSISCLDSESGDVLWSFVTEGPVRNAPTVVDDRVYFGSDDGCVYCLNAADGRLIWSHRVGTEDVRLPGNGRMISLQPARSGVVVQDGTVYVAAGLYPTQGADLVALDAGTGREIWKRPVEVATQGYLLATPTRLFIPTGRSAPAAFNRTDGTSLGSLGRDGGCFALVLDDMLIYGTSETGRITISEPTTREQIVSIAAIRAIAEGSMVYFLTKGSLAALDRGRYLELSRQIRDLERVKQNDRTPEQNQQLAEFKQQRTACRRWEVPCDDPYELILAGKTLFAGGHDQVTAFDAITGRIIWTERITGRAYGLAVSDGCLYVSTDLGRIYCFEPGTGSEIATTPEGSHSTDQDDHANQSEMSPLLPIPTRWGSSLVDCWLFRSDCIENDTVRNHIGKSNAVPRKPMTITSFGTFEAVELDGENSLTAGDHTTRSIAEMPGDQLTAEAWVRVDQPRQWGGLVGAIQDNGEYERGWLLGYDQSHFSLAVKGQNGKRLTYLKAESNYEPGQWYHVVGTYNGTTMRLYIDGRPAASSTEQTGPIDYPPTFFYDLAAYHDDDEFFPFTGALHEVRVYNRALTAHEIARHHAEKVALFADEKKLISRDPEVEPGDDGRVLIHWTGTPVKTVFVEYGRSGGPLNHRVRAIRDLGRYSAELTEIEPDSEYSYRILFGSSESSRDQIVTRGDMHRFDSGPQALTKPSPWPQDRFTETLSQAAEMITNTANSSPGYCLVLDAGDGRLVYEIAKRSNWRIIGVERDADKVADARRRLRRIGLYGKRVVIHHQTSDRLPYTRYFANIITSADMILTSRPPSIPATEVRRLLRPEGGLLILGGSGPEDFTQWSRGLFDQSDEFASGPTAWKIVTHGPITYDIVKRGPLPGRGEWTHTYAEPGNTASSGDQNIHGSMDLQWFGRPGPKRMIDRHHRNVPPLVKDGRCFIPGDCIIYAVDAYNGSMLWQVEVPDSRRLGVFLDTSNLIVDDSFLYIAAGNLCNGFDVRTGRYDRAWVMPNSPDGSPHNWGYLAYSGPMLFGSGCKPNAAYTTTGFDTDKALWYQGMSLVTSDYLFGMDRQNGTTRWVYRDSLILDTTLTLGDDRLYFIESTSPKAEQHTLGRMPLTTFFDGGEAYLTALDMWTGRVIYRRPIDTTTLRETAYLIYADGIVLLSGCMNEAGSIIYHTRTFDAETGNLIWSKKHNSGLPEDGGHGEYNRHPTVVGDTVYIWPYAYHLKTGREINDWRFARLGHGCGGISASACSLFWRGDNPFMYDLTPGGGPQRLTLTTRPGCWINIIPAQGLLLIPEASSGCTCPYSIQASIAFAPAPPRPVPSRTVTTFVRPFDLELTDPRGGGIIRYTLDGTEPDTSSPRYTDPIRIDKTTTLIARTDWPDGERSRILVMRYVQSSAQPAVQVRTPQPGLRYEYYEGHQITNLAGLQSWTLTTDDAADRITLDHARRSDDFGFIFKGFIKIPNDDVYTFYTRSDDGSRLLIDNQMVVDNDGLHGSLERPGTIALQVGWHLIEVDYFEAGGTAVLEVSWQSSDIPKQPIPPSALYH